MKRQMTEAFWEKYAGGAYIPEYCIVRAIKGHCSVRRLDALISPDEPHGRHGRRTLKGKGYDKLAGRNVIVVQTKAKGMGMYLMGQTLFSVRLVMAQGAKSVRSTLFCTGADSVLLPALVPSKPSRLRHLLTKAFLTVGTLILSQ
jgi:hypothetical protein